MIRNRAEHIRFSEAIYGAPQRSYLDTGRVFHFCAQVWQIPFTQFSRKGFVSSFTRTSDMGKVFNSHALTLKQIPLFSLEKQFDFQRKFHNTDVVRFPYKSKYDLIHLVHLIKGVAAFLPMALCDQRVSAARL